jgi:hypothetical protein
MKKQAESILTRVLALAMIAALSTCLATPGRGQTTAEDPAYVVEMADVTAKVGEPAVLHATLRVRDGYRVLKTYNNRVMELSSLDNSVTFDRRVVPGTVQDGGIDFAIGLRATKAGQHPINGYFRVGYIGTDEFAMVSLRLIANVNGTE